MIAKANKTQHLSLSNLKWVKVIEEFITNGQNPVQAYDIVYEDCKTAPQSACRLFKNVKFVQMLNIRIEEIKRKTERKVGEIDAMQQKAYNLAMKHKQPAAAVSAGTAIARLYGMDKDNDIGTATAPPPISLADLEVLRKLSLELNKRTLVESEVIENE